MGGALYSIDNLGSLYGVVIDINKSGEQAAVTTDKILKGIKAGTIPVVSGESYIEIDYKRASDQGFKVPEGLLKQANRIIR